MLSAGAILLISYLRVVQSLGKVVLVRSLETQLYSHYSTIWKHYHGRWTENNLLNEICNIFSIPVCVHDTIIGYPEKNCGVAECIINVNDNLAPTCSPTPHDTLEYLPQLEHYPQCGGFILDSIFNPTLIFNEGVPPYFTPITRVGLEVHGIVTVHSSQNCEPISGLSFVVYHADPSLMTPVTSPQTEGPTPYALSDITCAVRVTTDTDGRFTIQTTLPPSYGPPRHITVFIDAPGYRSIVTNIYFDKDTRLNQLFTNVDVDNTGEEENRYQRMTNVCLIRFVESNSSSGHFHCNITLVLEYDREVKEKEASSTIIPVDGLWFDETGQSVLVETHGYIFSATEYPNPRNWGTIAGYIRADTITGTEFSHSALPLVFNLPLSLRTSPSLNSLAKGFISIDDSTMAPVIAWTNEQSVFSRWNKAPSLHKYRYIKLTITQDNGSKYVPLEINEIQIFHGVLGRIPFFGPLNYLQSPRFPSPILASCSSFLDQLHHCFRVIDGDSSSSSSWRAPSNTDRKSPQWILLDLGIGNTISPTALNLVCGKSSNLAKGCPVSLGLSGSNDGKVFETLLFRAELSSDVYIDHSLKLTLFSESVKGRPNGYACGSCARAPYFNCRIYSYDGSCATNYCGGGICEELPSCAIGFYRSMVSDSALIDFRCVPCPAGTFGDRTQLFTPECSGNCLAGYYCPPASTSPTQMMCGSSNVFCEEGSGYPVPIPAGWFANLSNPTVSMISIDGAVVYSISSISVCSPGTYCVDGVAFPCPPGTYGNSSGLETSLCSSTCDPGFYCPSGTIYPISCGLGMYCPDGAIQVKCPAGHFGDSNRLTDRECSGLCMPGYYCLQGSVTATARPCPAGRFGSTYGLHDDMCSGNCLPGFYCPLQSVSPTERNCGGPNMFCPEASAKPIIVTEGYYTVGISNDTRASPINRVAQLICEPGFFCDHGLRVPCPPGSFGASQGMNNSQGLGVYFCSSRCPPGSFCGEGSSAPVACPAGTYGAEAGLKDIFCSGTCPIGHYCPDGSILPLPCKAGIFGNCTGSTDEGCRGGKNCYTPQLKLSLLQFESRNLNACIEGYYCPPGSISSTQIECGSSGVYCPKGSGSPIPVDIGYYTVPRIQNSNNGRTQSSQSICERGYFCKNGVKSPCPPGTFGSTFGESSMLCSDYCPRGYYCLSGSAATINGEGSVIAWNANIKTCPGGTYGISARKRFCFEIMNYTGSVKGLSLSTCEGPCRAGFYCPPGSILPDERFCGGSNLYCPQGSSRPIEVASGFYSYTEGDQDSVFSRVSQRQCEPGYFCTNGTRYICPAGTFGIKPGLTSQSCSGRCQKGFFCPAGSTTRVQIQCPAGTFGAEEGLTNSLCSGTCLHPLDCPEGTITPHLKI